MKANAAKKSQHPDGESGVRAAAESSHEGEHHNEQHQNEVEALLLLSAPLRLSSAASKPVSPFPP